MISDSSSSDGWLSSKRQKIDKEKREIPLVFFQVGDAKHLPYTLWQARRWAGNNPVVLLGDRSNRHYRGVRHVMIRDYASAVPRLKKSYIHMSSNSKKFEFLSLARWLVLEEFARKQGLSEFLYLDSDILLFDNPSNISQSVPKEYDMTLAWRGGETPMNAEGGQILIRNHKILNQLGKLIITFYENKNRFEDIRNTFQTIANNKGGGLSDMWFLGRLAENNKGKIYNSWRPEQQGVLDLNIGVADGFRTKNGVKEIRFLHGQPFALNEALNRWIRLGSIHFAGSCKNLIPKFLGRNPDCILILSRLRERVGKLLGLHSCSLESAFLKSS